MKRKIYLLTLLFIGSLFISDLTCAKGFKPTDFKEVINYFVDSFEIRIQDFIPHVKLMTIRDKEKKIDYRFFGVHVNNQSKINFNLFKNKVAQTMGVSPSGTIQIIGDSAASFSEQGTTYARKFLRDEFNRRKNSIIEYGYTGNKYDDHKELDTNALVNEYIDEKPAQSYRVLANVVGHAYIAVTEWGCYVSPNVRNFVVVYNEKMEIAPKFDESGKKIAGYSVFGDDITMSDFFLKQRDGDRLICLEGGAQSFLQAVNCLKRGIIIDLLYNIRKPTDTKPERFSTARLFKIIREAFEPTQPKAAFKILSKEDIRKICNDYLASIQSIWDLRKPDHRMKKTLFEKAMDEFINSELYKKIITECMFWDGTRRIELGPIDFFKK